MSTPVNSISKIVLYIRGKRVEFKNYNLTSWIETYPDKKMLHIVGTQWIKQPEPPRVATGLMDALNEAMRKSARKRKIRQKKKTKVVLPNGRKRKSRAVAQRKKVRRAKTRHAK